MAYQPLEHLLPKAAGSVYKLVRMASKRSLEISETGNRLVSAPLNTKLTTVALMEIRSAKVVEKSCAKEFEGKPNGRKTTKDNGQTM